MAYSQSSGNPRESENTARGLSRVMSHDRMADEFDRVMDKYDLERRLDTLVNLFLGHLDLSGLKVLDAGCGIGYASRCLNDRGGNVVSLDIGHNLVTKTMNRCQAQGVVGSVLTMPFRDGEFDVVLSTEVIEHTPAPLWAVAELCRILRPGGHLVLSTPNRAWLWSVALANRLGIRPYSGLENFVWPWQLRQALEAQGCLVVKHVGLHAFPFQVSLFHPVLRFLDHAGSYALPLMINQCVYARKPRSQPVAG